MAASSSSVRRNRSEKASALRPRTWNGMYGLLIETAEWQPAWRRTTRFLLSRGSVSPTSMLGRRRQRARHPRPPVPAPRRARAASSAPPASGRWRSPPSLEAFLAGPAGPRSLSHPKRRTTPCPRWSSARQESTAPGSNRTKCGILLSKSAHAEYGWSIAKLPSAVKRPPAALVAGSSETAQRRLHWPLGFRLGHAPTPPGHKARRHRCGRCRPLWEGF